MQLGPVKISATCGPASELPPTFIWGLPTWTVLAVAAIGLLLMQAVGVSSSWSHVFFACAALVSTAALLYLRHRFHPMDSDYVFFITKDARDG